MAKIQNLWTIRKALLWGFLILMLNVRIFSQNILLDHQVRMLALGDSYTIGESVETDQRWPHHFVAELEKRGAEVCVPDYIAATGWTTSDLMEGIAAGLDRDKSYNLVSVQIGVNNQYQGRNMELYEPELRKIFEMAIDIAGGVRTRVIVLSIPDYAYTPFGKEDLTTSVQIDAYNAIKEKVAGEYGIAYFNITHISRQGLSDLTLVASDGLHPSGKQYKLWVDLLCQGAKVPLQDDSADFDQIKRIIYQQEKDWNNGDIDAFMEAYWNSEELQFGGANGITKGWQETLERYKTSYPDRASMGRLTFQIKDMTRQSENVVSLTGSWRLIRENDQPGGHFLLVWRKIEGAWKIVVDHTSQKLP